MKRGIEAGVIKEIESTGTYTDARYVSQKPIICTQENWVIMNEPPWFFSHMSEQSHNSDENTMTKTWGGYICSRPGEQCP